MEEEEISDIDSGEEEEEKMEEDAGEDLIDEQMIRTLAFIS